MARPVPKTKAGKKKKMRQVLREFKEGTLRSGSQDGPRVTSRKQAVAIALSSSGQSRQPSRPSDSTRIKAKAVGGKKRSKKKRGA